MTSSDEWVKERARLVNNWACLQLRVTGGLVSATREDIERLQSEVATALQEATERGEKHLTARLRNPDEAMVEAVTEALAAYNECPLPASQCDMGVDCACRGMVKATVPTLADHLDEKEKAP